MRRACDPCIRPCIGDAGKCYGVSCHLVQPKVFIGALVRSRTKGMYEIAVIVFTVGGLQLRAVRQDSGMMQEGCGCEGRTQW